VPFTTTDHVTLAPDVVVERVKDEAVLLKLSDQVVFSLNTTGARITELIGRRTPIPAIVERLAREYHATEDEVAADVYALIHDLAVRHLVVVHKPGEAA
jgi:Coenzyme PQQ synthesis protein D (PqqD)